MAAPPPLWQHEVASLAREQARIPAAAGQRLNAADGGEEKLSETWRHVKGVARDESKHHDLMDLVRNARREDTYQFPVAGWPSLLRPLSSVMPELPAMVQDKYRTCQTMCFCGVFPEIRRAWASVDNSLYLWRYDQSNDVPVEYCGEEQAICCVGLAKPKPGVFLAAIQHVLVLATTVEIVLLGVCTSPSKGGGSDHYEELSLQPMPLYTLPSDNTIMTCFASSALGRIFMGANDGHVYEIQYAATDSWRQRRCSKVRVTGGIQQLLPGFLVPLFGQPTALDKLVVDDERHILYSLASNSAIQVGCAGCRHVGSPHRRRLWRLFLVQYLYRGHAITAEVPVGLSALSYQGVSAGLQALLNVQTPSVLPQQLTLSAPVVGTYCEFFQHLSLQSGLQLLACRVGYRFLLACPAGV
eukprot:GHUV01033740.1.p1 GENE.GHUV01033740.1~~GHUV01033740.1.p1  ORF type:complete len:413 (+),score=119.95 GHUV01033740.1:567-1805(+)